MNMTAKWSLTTAKVECKLIIHWCRYHGPIAVYVHIRNIMSHQEQQQLISLITPTAVALTVRDNLPQPQTAVIRRRVFTRTMTEWKSSNAASGGEAVVVAGIAARASATAWSSLSADGRCACRLQWWVTLVAGGSRTLLVPSVPRQQLSSQLLAV